MFPKKIWRLWNQGWKNAPYVVSHCTDSIYHYAPDWEIIHLDESNISDYIEIPEKINSIKNFPIQILSDLYRILLLKKYGGVWLDATIFLNTNLTDFLTPLKGDFFCFWRFPRKAGMDNWFLASEANSYIAACMSENFSRLLCSEAWLQDNLKFFDNWKGSPNYFSFHRLFEKLAKTNNEFSSHIQRMPFRDITPILREADQVWNRDITHESESAIWTTPLYKLTHNVKKENISPNSVFEKLIKKMKGELTPVQKHLHSSDGLRALCLSPQLINRPDKVRDIAGLLETGGHLLDSPEKFSGFHVLNFTSRDRQKGAQILIPHGTSEIFIRHQLGNEFSHVVAIASRNELELLRKQLETLQNEIVDLKTKLQTATFFSQVNIIGNRG